MDGFAKEFSTTTDLHLPTIVNAQVNVTVRYAELKRVAIYAIDCDHIMYSVGVVVSGILARLATVLWSLG